MNFSICTVAVLMAGTAAQFCTAAASTQGRPNVIIVITDDQGYGDLGCHGNTLIKTPNIDSFYTDSVRLTNYHVDPTCAPTRSALMTGRHSNRVGVWHTVLGRNMLRQREVTMANVFSQNGYETGLFGKWHLGDSYPYRPEDRGFSHVVMHGGGGVAQMPDYWGNDYFNDTYYVNGEFKKFEGFCTDNWFDEAESFIKKSKNDGKPFFAYIAPNAPHSPYRAPQKYLDMYDAEKTPAGFYGMITNIDDRFGLLQQLLKKEGLEHNTILVFTTDNGSSRGTTYYNACMKGKKNSAYDGGHRVPWFMRWPAGKIGGGKDVDQLTAHLDILPTFIDILKLDAPQVKFDGTSLKDIVYGNKTVLRDRSLMVESQRVVTPEKWRKSSLMSDKWRLINGIELYDIKNDSVQENNLANKFPEVVKMLRADYTRFWDDVAQDHHIFSAVALGAKQQNPTALTSHDHMVTKGLPLWNQPDINKKKTGEGPWMVDVVADGNYEISIRRWAAEADQPINAKYSGYVLGADRAYLDIDGIKQDVVIPKGAKEITFKVKLKKGIAYKLNTGFVVKGKRQAAMYCYVLNSDIYTGKLNNWQTREGMGRPLVNVDHTDILPIEVKKPRRRK